jgi:hypothetical protein
MIDLFDKSSGQLIGSITDAELEFMIGHLEETSLADRDYFVDQATIDLLADGSATDHLLELLRKAVGGGDGVEIRWERR